MIVVYKLDRLSRSVKDFYELWELDEDKHGHLERERAVLQAHIGIREVGLVDSEKVAAQLRAFHELMNELSADEQKDFVRLMLKEVRVNRFDQEKQKGALGDTQMPIQIRTNWYSLNITLFSNELFARALRDGIKQFVSNENGCARRGRGRSIDLIIGVAFPAGRSKERPSIFSPFQHPPMNVERRAGIDPRDKVLAAVAKVRSWSRQLSSGRAATFAEIAAEEGVSVARVSQLMVLARLTAEEVERFLSRSTRPSLRGLISLARGFQRGGGGRPPPHLGGLPRAH